MTKYSKCCVVGLLAIAVSAAGAPASAQNFRRIQNGPTLVNTRDIPAVDTQKSNSDRMDWMAGQIAALERKVADDESVIASLSAEVEVLRKPPVGYTRAFITITNFGHLSPDDGIVYYARTK
jgi:hypothetical protein